MTCHMLLIARCLKRVYILCYRPNKNMNHFFSANMKKHTINGVLESVYKASTYEFWLAECPRLTHWARVTDTYYKHSRDFLMWLDETQLSWRRNQPRKLIAMIMRISGFTWIYFLIGYWTHTFRVSSLLPCSLSKYVKAWIISPSQLLLGTELW